MSRALRYLGTVSLVDRPAPLPHPGHLRLRVHLAGVCRTDVGVAEGRLPAETPVILGHEAAGTVDAVADDVSADLLGKRFAVDPWFAAGQAGVIHDGAFAEHWVVPVARCIPVPAHWTDQRAAFLEPVAASLAPSQWLPEGCEVTVGGSGRIAELTRRVLHHRGFVLRDSGPIHAAVETHPSGVPELVDRLQPGGLLILKSRPGASAPLPWDAVVRKQLRLQGAWYGDFHEAATVLDDLPIDDLLGATFALADWQAAFASAHGETHKVFLDPRR